MRECNLSAVVLEWVVIVKGSSIQLFNSPDSGLMFRLISVSIHYAIAYTHCSFLTGKNSYDDFIYH